MSQDATVPRVALMPYLVSMALMQELTNQGRVVGGHLVNGVVDADRFKGGLSIQHPANPFKRSKLNAATVLEWEELITKDSVAGLMGQAAAKAALPGMLGAALGAGLGASMRYGHTVRVDWSDGNQSLLTLPEKLFLTFSVLLKDKQVVTEMASPRGSMPEPSQAQPGVTEKIVDLASSVLQRNRTSVVAEPVGATDAVEQLEKLASLRDAGILTEEEFAAKKAELLKRL